MHALPNQIKDEDNPDVPDGNPISFFFDFPWLFDEGNSNDFI